MMMIKSRMCAAESNSIQETPLQLRRLTWPQYSSAGLCAPLGGRDNPASKHAVTIVENGGLAGRYRPQRPLQRDLRFPSPKNNRRRLGLALVAHLYLARKPVASRRPFRP